MAARIQTIVSDLRTGLGAVRLRSDIKKVTLVYSSKSDNSGARYFARENLPRIQYNNPTIEFSVQKSKETNVAPELSIEFSDNKTQKISCSRILSSDICKQFLSATTPSTTTGATDSA